MNILRQRLFTYEDDELEAYEELDSKKIAKLTDNQKKMLLEDERKKAKRNQSRIVSRYGKQGAKKGREEGKRKGTTRGAIIGGLGGALFGGLASGKTRGALVGGALGAGGGALLGRYAGGESGAAEGRSKGEAKGRKIAKEQGHDDIDRTTKNARILDDYARTHKKGKDDWEIGFRNQLKVEKKEREEAAERKRQAELEKRRVEAEEQRAKAEREKARTDRDRYWDEHFGWGQYSRERKSSGNTTNNYYYRMIIPKQHSYSEHEKLYKEWKRTKDPKIAYKWSQAYSKEYDKSGSTLQEPDPEIIESVNEYIKQKDPNKYEAITEWNNAVNNYWDGKNYKLNLKTSKYIRKSTNNSEITDKIINKANR